MRLQWLEQAASTQDDLVRAAREGAGPQALATLDKTGGRGRRGRAWTTPPGAGLALSVLLRPRRRDGWTLLPLVSGVGVATALHQLGATDAVLKWPNDVLAHGGKVAGLLAERVPPARPRAADLGDAFVLGIGLNLTRAGLPAQATALEDLTPGAMPDPSLVAPTVLAALQDHVEVWEDRDDESVRRAYRERCSTLGRDVQALLPGGDLVRGRAVDVDPDGQLVLQTAQGRRRVSAGDVVHLRPGSTTGDAP